MNKGNESPHKKKTLAPTLPEDLILEILYKLPPESLVQCTAVCKSWNQLIGDPTFIPKHLQTSLSNKNDSRVLILCRKRRSNNTIMYYCSFCMDNEEELKEGEVFDFPFRSQYCEFDVHGFCNGIACLMDVRTRYGFNCILWNPSIRKYHKLPPPRIPMLVTNEDRFYDHMAFGFDSSTGDFKVLRFRTKVFYRKSRRRHLLEVEVYSLNDGFWRIIVSASSSTNVRLEYRLISEACCVNNHLHWIAYPSGKLRGGIAYNVFILVFDLTSEVFYSNELPPSARSLCCYRYVAALRQSSLAVIEEEYPSREQFNIWVRKEYADVDSWTKLWSFDRSRLIPKTLGSKNEELVFRTTIGESILLDLDAQQAYKPLVKSNWSSNPDNPSVRKSVQSLALFDKGDDVSSYMETLESYEDNPSDWEVLGPWDAFSGSESSDSS